jgi:hypothetical protein
MAHGRNDRRGSTGISAARVHRPPSTARGEPLRPTCRPAEQRTGHVDWRTGRRWIRGPRHRRSVDGCDRASIGPRDRWGRRVDGITTMGNVASGMIGRPRFHAVVVSIFALVAGCYRRDWRLRRPGLRGRATTARGRCSSGVRIDGCPGVASRNRTGNRGHRSWHHTRSCGSRCCHRISVEHAFWVDTVRCDHIHGCNDRVQPCGVAGFIRSGSSRHES